MTKLTKAQKAQYPEFIAYVDFCANFGTEFPNGLLIKAMTETTLLQSMQWHIRDEAHGEAAHGLYSWLDSGDGSRYGMLDFVRKV